jgi:hypothetical protein
VVSVCLVLAGCQQTPGGVANQVMMDFGLRDKPEGYVSGADRVMENLAGVARTEMKRLNVEQRHGEVAVQEEGLHSKYYKTAKKYEQFHVLDAQPTGRTPDTDTGYVGYVEYTYRIYESARKTTQAEAAALSASIPTDDSGREVYRYRFSMSGIWDGAKGEQTRGR